MHERAELGVQTSAQTMIENGDIVTIRRAATALQMSVRAVQLDVQAGCPGIVRPGCPGRGRGALIDLAAYSNWRAQRAGAMPVDVDHERQRAWQTLLESAASTFRDYGGVTRQSRQRAGEVLIRLLLRYHKAAFGRDVEDLPDEMRNILRVLQDCDRRLSSEL